MSYKNFSRLPSCPAKPQVTLDFEKITPEERELIVTVAYLLTHPWDGYCPTKVTERFHRSLSRLRYIIAASQVGKTIAAARETWMHAGQCHPFRHVRARAKLGLIAVGSLEGTAYDAVNRALYATCPQQLVDWSKTTWNGKNFVGNFIRMTNGNVIRIVSSRGGSTGAAGVTADYVWIDEPPKKDKFSELLARVTQTDGSVWLTFTPYDSEQADLDWLRMYLEGKPDLGIPPESPGWERFNLELSVENCPWMTQDKVDAVYAATPLWVAEQRLKGAWETPPINGYFALDTESHDWNVFPFDEASEQAGPWLWECTVDHGELAMHQAAVFYGVRRVRLPRLGGGFQVGVEVKIVGEYVSQTRTSFDEDAKGMKHAMERIARGLELPRLAEPSAWGYVGDINSAGKGMAGQSANEALAIALGVRSDAFRIPDKSPGSVNEGLMTLKTAIDKRPCALRLAAGSVGELRTPELWRSLRGHSGKADSTKHLVDTLRYGVVPYLDLDALALNRLGNPPEARAFAVPSRRTA